MAQCLTTTCLSPVPDASYLKAALKDESGAVKAQWEADWQALAPARLQAVELAKIAASFVGADEETRSDWIILLNSMNSENANQTEVALAMARLGIKYGESFSIAAEVWAYASEEVKSLPPEKQGLIMGQLAGEIIGLIWAPTKITKVSKAESLTKMSQGKFAKTSEGASVFAKIGGFIQEIFTTKMCFVAGTLVHAATASDDLVHYQPIKNQHKGGLVWAQNELTGEVAKKRIVATFVTHPDVLHSVTIDRDGDGAADETISGTAPHPFWAPDEGRWIPMGDLAPGMRLHIHRNAQTPAYVLSNQQEHAPPGETFTTYNFEVEDFHTYFVGEAGVWVHNKGQACEKIFSIWIRYRERGLGPWEAFEETVNRTAGVSSQSYGLAAGAAMEDIYRMAAIGEKVTIPTHSMVKKLMRGRNIEFTEAVEKYGDKWADLKYLDEASWKSLALESHHSIPSYVQKLIKPDITQTTIDDNTPSFLTSMHDHKLEIDSLHAVINKYIPEQEAGRTMKFGTANPSRQTLIDELEKAYVELGMFEMWTVVKKYIP